MISLASYQQNGELVRVRGGVNYGRGSPFIISSRRHFCLLTLISDRFNGDHNPTIIYEA